MTAINPRVHGTGQRSGAWSGALRMLCLLLLPVVVALVNGGCMSSGVDSLRIEPYRPVTERSGEWFTLAHPSLAHSEAVEDVQAPAGPRTVEASVVKVSETSDRPSAVVALPQVAEAGTDASGSDGAEVNERVRAFEHGDRVTIQLNGPETTRIEDVVDNTGRVTLPLIGHIMLAGRTTAEVEKAIERAYIDGKIYKYINVIVVSLDDEFFVRGEVNREGRFSLTGNMTLGKALIVAGGYTEFAKRTEVMIRRGNEVLEFNMKKIDTGEVPDPVIRRGDVIVVKRRWVW